MTKEDEENKAILKRIMEEDNKNGDWTDEDEVLKAIRLTHAAERKRIEKDAKGASSLANCNIIRYVMWEEAHAERCKELENAHKKIKELLAKQARISTGHLQAGNPQRDGDTMRQIKFSHNYDKLSKMGIKDGTIAILMAVQKTRFEMIPGIFKKYDCAYEGGAYELPNKGECLLLIFWSGKEFFPTIRSTFPPDKVDYYKRSLFEQFEVKIKGGK